MDPSTLAGVRKALDALASGEPVIVVDDVASEDEGDLILAADRITTDRTAFVIAHTSGLACLPATGEALDRRELPAMVVRNTDPHHTAFAVSTDLRHGTTS